MNSSLYWTIKILNNRKKHKTIKKHIKSALLGIIFSIIPLVIAIIAANGMIDGITNRIIEIDSGIIKLYQREIHTIEETEIFAEEIENKLSVYAYPMLQGEGILFSQNDNNIVTVRAINSGSYSFKHIELIDGTLSLKNKTIMISKVLAEQLDVDVDDKITLLTFAKNSSGRFSYKPSFYTITGICTSGYRLIDESLVFLDYGSSASIFNTDDSRVIKVLSGDIAYDNAYIQNLSKEIEKLSDGEWAAVPWNEQYQSLYNNYRTTKILLYIIMALIIITAGINISSCSKMIILENNTHIGILKSQGVPVKKIRLTFLLAGSIIGLTGTAAGIAAGVLIGSQINEIFALIQMIDIRILDFYLTEIDFSLPFIEIVLVFVYGAAISLLSAFLPTRYINKINPIKLITNN